MQNRLVKKNHSAKLTFPEDLPVERIIINVKEEEKICPETGKPNVFRYSIVYKLK